MWPHRVCSPEETQLQDTMKDKLRMLGAMAFGFAALAMPPAVAQSATLPFKSENGLMLVMVTVSGEPKTLIFDTGAQRTIINERDAHVERRNIAVAFGNYACTMPIIFIDMGMMPVNVSHTVDKSHSDGILGQDFLSKFSAIKIDNKVHTIELLR